MSGPRVLFLSRTRYRLPLEPGLQRKWDELARRLELRVVGRGAGSQPPFALMRRGGALFYLCLPFVAAREIHRFKPDAIVTQSPYEALAALAGRRLAGRRPLIVAELHGDWRTATRLYGSPLRRALSPLADAAGAAALRRVDAVRTLSDFTTRLAREVGVEPAAAFPAYVDLAAFTGPPRPLPDTPRLLFVGVLERYKNVDGLVAAWRLAAPRLPGTTLRIVGVGPAQQLVEGLVGELPEQTEWTPRLPPEDVAAALDASSALVLPSRSEGLPRIVLEAFCRGRPVAAAAAGGIPDLVRDGETGLLARPGDAAALADALVRLVGDRPLLERLAAGAAEAGKRVAAEADAYPERVAALVASLLAEPRKYHRPR